LAFQHTGLVNLSKLNQWSAQVLWPNQDASDKVLMAMLKDPNHHAKSKKENKKLTQIFHIKGLVLVHYSSEEDMDDTDNKAYVDATTRSGSFLD
jgi:hypothetical protein